MGARLKITADMGTAEELGKRLLWTIDEVMRLLRCSRSAVYDLAAEDRLVLVKVQASSRITDESLRQYYEHLLATRPKLKGRRRREKD